MNKSDEDHPARQGMRELERRISLQLKQHVESAELPKSILDVKEFLQQLDAFEGGDEAEPKSKKSKNDIKHVLKSVGLPEQTKQDKTGDPVDRVRRFINQHEAFIKAFSDESTGLRHLKTMVGSRILTKSVKLLLLRDKKHRAVQVSLERATMLSERGNRKAPVRSRADDAATRMEWAVRGPLSKNAAQHSPAVFEVYNKLVEDFSSHDFKD